MQTNLQGSIPPPQQQQLRHRHYPYPMDGIMELEYTDDSYCDNDNDCHPTDPLLIVDKTENHKKNRYDLYDDDDAEVEDDSENLDFNTTSAATAVYRLYLDGTTNHDDTVTAGVEEERLIVSRSSRLQGGAIANVCSATLGAGVLSLPYALYQAGIVTGTMLLLGAGIGTMVSIDILIQAMEYYQIYTPSYEALAHAVLSKQRQSSQPQLQNVRTLVEVSILVFCGGCAVAYVIAIQDILKTITTSYTSTMFWLLFLYTTVMIPLCLLKRIQSLQYASILSMAAIGTLLFTATLHYLIMHTDNNHNDDGGNIHDSTRSTILWNEEQPTSNHTTNSSSTNHHHHLRDYLAPSQGIWSILTATPVVIFAFSCQVNVCQIYQELKLSSSSSSSLHNHPPNHHHDNNQSPAQRIMRQVTIVAVTLCATLYLSMSLVGLADFGNQLQPNLLSCYNTTSTTTNNNNHRLDQFMSIADIAMGLSIVLAFPLNIFPARTTILGWMMRMQKQQRPHHANPNHNNDDGDYMMETSMSRLQTPFLANDNHNRNHRPNSEDENDNNHAASVIEWNTTTIRSFNADEEKRINIKNSHNAEEAAAVDPSHEDNRLYWMESNQDMPEDDPTEVSMRLHVVTTLFLTGIVLALALILPNISVVFGLLGGTAASLLGFCVPGAIGIRMTNDQYQATGHACIFTQIASYTLLIGGTIVGILTTIVTIYNTLIMSTTSTPDT